MKFVELGKDPEAEPSTYAKVISSDASLSAKLLALANSSWFGVRNKVTKVGVAVNLLGLSTVRTLAISFCATGLHNELKLEPDESRMFWSACLCKAVAAKTYAAMHDEKAGEEAFVVGLFQDFALPVMYATAKEPMLNILKDASLNNKNRLVAERALMHLDHAELGRSIAQKLELPDMFVDAVAFHHNPENLLQFLDKELLADAATVASCFPHLLDAWNHDDACQLRQLLADKGVEDTDAFMASVQQEFDALFGYFEGTDSAKMSLSQLLEDATREIADNTTRMVGKVHEMMQEAVSAGKALSQVMQIKDDVQQAALRDPLTGVLNRAGLDAEAAGVLKDAARYGISLGVVFMDIDKFKSLNDTRGHAWGDAALKHVATTVQKHLRAKDLMARVGGDEFVLLLNDCSQANALEAVSRAIAAVAKPEGQGGKAGAMHATLSAGMTWLPGKAGPPREIEQIIAEADKLMYEAKRAGG